MNRKILLAVPRLNIGGAETYVHQLALGLQKRGHQVFVASGGGALARDLERHGIRHFFVPMRLHAGLAAWLLSRIVQKYNIDIVHANSAAAGIAAVKLKEKLPVKVVYTAHGVFGHNAKERTINRADRIICVSRFVEQYAREKGYSDEKLRTVYTGIDMEKFRPRPALRAKLRQQQGIPAEAFVLAIVARIKNLRNKGHEDLLQVLGMPGAERWHLAVIGKGRGLSRLQAEIKNRGMGKRVHCLGHCGEVQDVLEIADAMVLPSRLETFGLVLAEAMAMEKPVAAYAVGGTPEVIKNGGTGFLIELGNIGQLQERINLWAEDRDLCCRMGHAGREWVGSSFSQRKMLDEVERIYDEI